MPSSECVWEWPCCCKNKSVKQNYPFCQDHNADSLSETSIQASMHVFAQAK